jgi:hypothetical protein
MRLSASRSSPSVKQDRKQELQAELTSSENGGQGREIYTATTHQTLNQKERGFESRLCKNFVPFSALSTVTYGWE